MYSHCNIKFQDPKIIQAPSRPVRAPDYRQHLHLGLNPHHSLAKLAGKYGPVMKLKLGSIITVVISSPEAARAVLRKHDASFPARTIPGSIETLGHNDFSMAWVPTGKQWRKLRKICKEQMFSVPRLEASQDLRREKLQKLRNYVRECCGTGRAVDVGEAAFATSLNLMSASLFSVEFAAWGSDSSQDMKELVWGVMQCIGTPNFSDYFPVLKSADPQGILRKTKFYFEKLFARFDEIIDERLKSKSRGEKYDDMLEALIDLNQRNEADLSREDLNHLLLDLFVAGSDTTSGTVEWAMSELIRNPWKLSILKKEIRDFMEENGQVEEADIPRLPYLQAVVKETFRLHPAAPFLIPRKAGSDVEINGYIIPKNAQILVNVWASGRGPNIWANANEFVPERFLIENDRINFWGQHFELIPFGAGRRICPGLPLANRMVHQMLVTFVANFDWKLEAIKPEEIDMNEKFGLTLQKAVSLKAIPTKTI